MTITTLPGAGQEPGQRSVSAAGQAATITPARITPIIPANDDTRPVPGSPRPSILRKRPDTEHTPVKAALLTSPPPRPESSGSSTISATSTLPGMSGDDHAAPVSAVEPSPRKRARKQQLPPRDNVTNVSPEWATAGRSRLDWSTQQPEADWEGKVRNWNNSWTGGETENSWDHDMAPDQADDEEELSSDEEKPLGSFIRGKPQVSLLHSYRHTWKSRHNHFLRYTDVKSKVGTSSDQKIIFPLNKIFL